MRACIYNRVCLLRSMYRMCTALIYFNMKCLRAGQFQIWYTACGWKLESSNHEQSEDKAGKIGMKTAARLNKNIGGQQGLAPFSLSILVLQSHWEMAISRRCVLKMKAGKEKQKESERKESLLRHLHQSVVRRVMNLAPLLPSNQWLTLSHTHTHTHTHSVPVY